MPFTPKGQRVKPTVPELDIAPEEKTMSASILVSRLSLFSLLPLEEGGWSRESFL